MSLHQLRFNKKNISFKNQQKRTLPPTCDTIIKNLLKKPKRHLSLIRNKNENKLLNSSTNKSIEVRKMEGHLIKGFSVDIISMTHAWKPSQLTDFLNKIENQSVRVDGSYIMQPIIVKPETPNENLGWTLVDDQLRITSIYMILKYLESNNFRLSNCTSSADVLNKHFLSTVRYDDWDTFLENTQSDDSIVNDNLSNIYQVLHDWFSKKTAVEQEIWKRKLLNHTKFIWYVSDSQPFESENCQKQRGMGIESKYLS